MKKIVFVLVCFISFKKSGAQISDSTVKVFSRYICDCADTIDIKKPEAELRKQFSFCQTLALTSLLNDQLITPDMLADEKQAGELETKTFSHLAANCDAIKRLIKALSTEPEFEETNDNKLFTPPAFFETYKLKQGETNDRLHVYNNFEKDGTKFQRVVDIRWTFKTEEDAIKWHQLNIRKNSEEGAPVEDMIIIQGTKELRVFREGPGAADMMKALGIGQRHHYFLFVYKNIVCKVFVATDEKTGTLDVVPFAIAAVQQLKAVIK